jgi:hypothetical protein
MCPAIHELQLRSLEAQRPVEAARAKLEALGDAATPEQREAAQAKIEAGRAAVAALRDEMRASARVTLPEGSALPAGGVSAMGRSAAAARNKRWAAREAQWKLYRDDGCPRTAFGSDTESDDSDFEGVLGLGE